MILVSFMYIIRVNEWYKFVLDSEWFILMDRINEERGIPGPIKGLFSQEVNHPYYPTPVTFSPIYGLVQVHKLVITVLGWSFETAGE